LSHTRKLQASKQQVEDAQATEVLCGKKRKKQSLRNFKSATGYKEE